MLRLAPSFLFRVRGRACAWLMLVAAVGVMGSTGCSKEGTYVLNLKFGTVDGISEDVTAYGCGFHGIAAWYLTETGDDAGVYPCGKTTITRTTKPGSYQIIVRALDTEGNDKSALPYLIAPLLPGAWPDVKVEADKTNTVTDPLYIQPLPQCADGVDNDCDGRVDLQDPACSRAPGLFCSSHADCTMPGFSFCNTTFGACLSDGPELGADNPVGSGCVNMKKDGGASEPDAAADGPGAGGQGAAVQDGAGGQGAGGQAAGGQAAGGQGAGGGANGGAGGEIGAPEGGAGGQGGLSTGQGGAGGV